MIASALILAVPGDSRSGFGLSLNPWQHSPSSLCKILQWLTQGKLHFNFYLINSNCLNYYQNRRNIQKKLALLLKNLTIFVELFRGCVHANGVNFWFVLAKILFFICNQLPQANQISAFFKLCQTSSATDVSDAYVNNPYLRRI